MSDKRQLIVVDVETTGLDSSVHVPIEVAAVNFETGEELYFVPHLRPEDLVSASPEALEINRYFERGVWREMLSPFDTRSRYIELFQMLDCNTLGGSNPRFDSDMLRRGYHIAVDSWPKEVWHHRLADIANYAGTALQLAPHELVGLADVCKGLGVSHFDEHSALGDVRATVACFRKLVEQYMAEAL